jgi:ribose 5-phosphate isomerase B
MEAAVMLPTHKESILKIYVSSDHAGFNLRKSLVNALKTRGFDVDDLGPQTADPLDYPDEADKVGRLVRDTPGSRGLLLCGTGVGMCMAANKVRGVRAVDAWNVESARLSRAHNDANVLCLGGRLLSEAEASAILDVWLSTPFEGGRHSGRVAKMDRLDGIDRTEQVDGRSASSPAGSKT